MRNQIQILLFILGFGLPGGFACAQALYHEPYRPQLHFSPKQMWMNDPNGMVYYEGVYHLFFQYHPQGMTWGPMHWGHAVSKDLVHWDEQPIALYPDSLGMIFSGSVIVDVENTSGFGTEGKAPLVALYTSHNMPGEHAGRIDFQRQCLAYSLDAGRSWTKYSGNPVLPNPGIRDFRDPKLSWHAPSRRWIMVLAVKDHAEFYSSPDLKTWTKTGQFGHEQKELVWECPDLFTVKTPDGQERYVLTVSTNPGGPNGGSTTRYYVGSFDGKTFSTGDTALRYMDWGPDNYAGVTWANTGERRIALGWMSNWQYAQHVPTSPWRSAMTVPRDLSLQNVDGHWLLVSRPIGGIKALEEKPVVQGSVVQPPFRLILSDLPLQDFSITLSNAKGQELVLGYDEATNRYFIDRSRAGRSDFDPGFARRLWGPRLSKTSKASLTALVDISSIELFADDGLTAMTAIFFPDQPFTRVRLGGAAKIARRPAAVVPLRSIWYSR